MRTENVERDVEQVTARMQKLVDKYHDQNLLIQQTKSESEGKLSTVAQSIIRLGDRIPEQLNEKMIGVSLTLQSLVEKVNKIGSDLERDYVGRTEFEIMKVEHTQMKRLMWGFIGLVLTAVVSGVIALVLGGQALTFLK